MNNFQDLDPSLKAAIAAGGLDSKSLCVALNCNQQPRRIRVEDRHGIQVSDGVMAVSWRVPALSTLFRGNGQPPRDIDHYPPEFVMHFFLVEQHFMTLCKAIGDRPDQEMEEIYGALRRRPDGRSLGPIHDFFWQVAALLLATRIFSEAEFVALFGQLERSTRKFAMRPVSRFYANYINTTYGETVR